MEAKVAAFINKGMRKDLSISKSLNDFAFHNHNIRITARDKDTLLSVTNEKGNKAVKLKVLQNIKYNKITIDQIVQGYAKSEYPLNSDIIITIPYWETDDPNTYYKKVLFPKNTDYVEFDVVEMKGGECTLSITQDDVYAYYIDTPFAIEYPILESLPGIIIGQCILNNYLVLFTVDDKYSYIIRVEESNNEEFYCKILYKGNLNFSTDYPIEALGYFEANKLQKVYWVDGLNQPRMINITEEEDRISKWIDTSFDFVRSYKDLPKVEITKEYSGSGNFSSGVVQYAISYYNKFGQETNLVYISPLYYLSMLDRGAKQDEIVNCSFAIKISNCDTSFDYVRLYSIIKNNYSGEAEAKILIDLPITEEILEYTDTGVNGELIDPIMLNYLGGVEITANTLNQKDGTLFFGNIELFNIITDDLKNYIKNNCIESNGESKVISFEYSKEENSLQTGTYKDVYTYKNQLAFNSNQIKTFKRGERYRFGIRFITKTGRKTDAIWLGDKTNTLCPIQHDNYTERAVAVLNFTNDVIEKIKKYNFVSCELLMVNPSVNERSILAQGIVLPTMFNLQQRCDNIPYSISSWFTRPKLTNIANAHFSGLPLSDSFYAEVPYVIEETHPFYKQEDKYEEEGTEIELNYWLKLSKTKKVFGKTKKYWTIGYDIKRISSTTKELLQILYLFTQIASTSIEHQYEEFKYSIENLDIVKDTALPPLEWFKDNMSVAEDASDKTVSNTQTLLSADTKKIENLNFIKNNSEHYFIDESIVNLYSPDLEETQSNIDNSDLKFRIVGYSKVTSNISDYEILNSTQGLSLQAGINSFNFNTGAETFPVVSSYEEDNIRKRIVSRSVEGLLSFPLWRDYMWDYLKVDTNDEDDLKKNGWNVKEEHTLWQIYPWQKEGSLNYQPLIDLSDNTLDAYGNITSADLKRKVFSNLRIANSTVYFNSKDLKVSIWEPKGGIYKPRVFNSDEDTYISFDTPEGKKQYQGNYDNLIVLGSFYNEETKEIELKKYPAYNTGNTSYADLETVVYSDSDYPLETSEPIRIKYKTTPHAVFSFKEWDNKQILLPNCPGQLIPLNTEGYTIPWNMDKVLDFEQDAIFEKANLTFNTAAHVLVGELYRELDVTSLYGGITESALKANVFIPISNVVQIKDLKNGVLGLEGDTYYQRWDCLKTYPFTEEDTNSVVDIISCMLETHINIDGRCDTNRNNSRNIYARPTNFNLLNKVYSQINNSFPSFYLDEKFTISKYPTQITWSKTKINTADTDLWTNITLSGIIELDGNKGKLSSIQKYNNNLIAFQDRGISEIMFNSRTQLSTDVGVPVEIANTGKVDGYRYITEQIGCLNKWSIQPTLAGIYFIDDYNKSIMLINEGIHNLSNDKGFNVWTKDNCTLKEWKPLSFDNFITHYDSVNKDVYFINKNYALIYSEILGEFTSFMDYQEVAGMYNLNNHFISHKNNKNNSTLWLQNEGEYNNFFNELKNYYITFNITPDQFKDRIFTNVEYKADVWDNNVLTQETFTKLKVNNEYQEGEININYKLNGLSSAKEKFRTWRLNIPRDKYSKHQLDRIRNPWIELTLKKEVENFNRMEFHNFVVKYFE